MDYPKPLRAKIAAVAAAAGAPVVARGAAWSIETARSTMRYADQGFSLVSNRPRLVGAHQSRNLALAIAMLRHQGALHIPEAAMRAAADWAHWPARMQRLSDGPLLARLPRGSDLWLDGAHNPNAAQPVARALRTLAKRRPVTLILGMLANKDADAVIRILSPSIGHVIAIPVPGHAHHAPEALAAIARTYGTTADTAPSPADALDRIAAGSDQPNLVLIAGSLYLAGEVLAANDQPPD
jgi:dihydrofolate synthase/folylpolyglutamate synthase